MKNKFLKEYITCYLFEEIETVTKYYLNLLDKYELSQTIDLGTKEEKRFRVYEDRLLSFFNNIIENEPLKDIDNQIEEWGKEKDSLNYNQKNVFEELIATYTILKETLTQLLPEYTNDTKISDLTINELELLDQKIQEYITEKYRASNIKH